MGTIRTDSKSIIVNGKRLLMFAGAVHYPRSTPDMWPGILRACKRAGINCIETYVFWEGHEPREGQYNFTGRFDLPYFLSLCRKEGLYVMLRIGPYVCAEWNFGGLAWWLIKKKGMVTRTWNRPFMQAVERWVRVLLQHVGQYQITRGGPIILAQMENEYNNVAFRYGGAGQKYLRWIGDMGRSAGIEVPLIMCEGASEDTLETLNGFRVAHRVAALRKRRPDQPILWTENYPAWYSCWTQAFRCRTAENMAYEVLRFVAAGGTGVNYYMWHGGTNLERDAMYLHTTTYDFDAPIDEYGLVTTKSHKLQKLHAFLRRHEAVLLQGRRSAERVLRAGDAPGDNLYLQGAVWKRRSVDFLVNGTACTQTVQYQHRTYVLPSKGVLVLARTPGARLERFRSWTIAPHKTVRRRMTPMRTALHWSMLEEPLPFSAPDHDVRPVKRVRLPHNMLLETDDGTDFGWYRTFVHSSTRRTAGLTVHVADVVSVWVNGVYIHSLPTHLLERRHGKEAYRVAMDVPLDKGKNEIVLLAAAVGLIKGDWMIDAPMSEEKKGLVAEVLLDHDTLPGPWSFRPGTWGETVGLYEPGAGSLAGWKMPVREGGPLRWYKTSFALSRRRIQSGVPLALDIGALFKGTIWLNGRSVGRYWQQAPSDLQFREVAPFDKVDVPHPYDPPQRFYHLPLAWTRSGSNILVILEERGAMPDAVRVVSRT